jgi:hypothetical protein
MPVLSAIQSRNAESPAVGSLRFRCENIGFSKPPTVRGGLAGTLYTTPSVVGYPSRGAAAEPDPPLFQ